LSVTKQDWSQNECILKGASGLYTQPKGEGGLMEVSVTDESYESQLLCGEQLKGE
jgi:hypothetical protein